MLVHNNKSNRLIGLHPNTGAGARAYRSRMGLDLHTSIESRVRPSRWIEQSIDYHPPPPPPGGKEKGFAFRGQIDRPRIGHYTGGHGNVVDGPGQID